MSSSTSELYSAAKTGIFWDLDDCPIPNDLSLASVYDNIISALKNKGYTGTVSITAYSLKKQNEKEFESAAIKLVQPEDSRSKYRKMFLGVYLWGINHLDEPTNLMVISKDLSHDVHYFTALLELKEKENNILLAQPAIGDGMLRFIVTVWLWASLSTGGSPLHYQCGCLLVVPTPPTSSSPGGGSQLRANKKQMKRRFKRGHKKRKNRAPTRSED